MGCNGERNAHVEGLGVDVLLERQLVEMEKFRRGRVEFSPER